MARRKLIWFLICVASLSTRVAAQHSGAYVFVAPVEVSRNGYTYWQGPFFQAGGGGEAALGSRFTLGGEATALLPRAQFGQTAGLLSIGPYFHFLPAQGKFDPFVTGGGAVLAGNGVGAMWYYGGGANYWFHRNIGLRVEFRDHVWAPEGSAFHFLGFRVGASFRFGQSSGHH